MKNLFKKIKKFQKPAVWALLFLNITLASGYVYAVNRTVFNVVATTKAEKTLTQSSAMMTDLESEQVSLKNKITLDFAYAQGFQDASNQQIFIVNKPIANALSFNAL
jgi:cell division protein FtsI/penicillin-binding protein 2